MPGGHFVCKSCGTVVPEQQCSGREMAFLGERIGRCDRCAKGGENMGKPIGDLGARELAVPAQLGQLDEAMTRLGEAVSGLVKRLEPVSQPHLPMPETGGGGKVASTDQLVCDMAGKIRLLRQTVNVIREVVEGQVARLEI